MLIKATIEKFKNIEKLELDLSSIEVLIGGNNAGKSSALQAIQFSVSLLETLALESDLTFSNERITKTLAPEQIIYSPIKDIYSLIYGNEPLREGPGREIVVRLTEEDDIGEINEALVSIKKGRNKNISVSYQGEKLCKKIAQINPVFSMYVPGLAGIPYYEEYRSVGAVRRAAARGDCNTILRNVLYHLYQVDTKKENFLNDLNSIFPQIDIEIDARLENDGIIDVSVRNNGYKKPIDSMGTGILQAVQICAYMNYFEPQLLLLDEPDSHLHPNNQKMLAQMILQLSRKHTNIIIATHSRHLVSALRKDSNIAFLKNGGLEKADYSEYDILMEIGALDEYDVFRDPNIKYIIATEDIKKESNNMLSLILQASGFSETSFYIIPYEGCSKVDSVIYLSKCLKKFRADLKIIVHRDRDGMTDDESKKFIDSIQIEDNIKCFITKFNDLEMYYCSKHHLFSILSSKKDNITYDDVEKLFDDSYSAIKDEALKKYLNRKLDSMRNQGRGEVAVEANRYFDENTMQCLNGHLMFGQIISAIHRLYHLNKADLLIISEALVDDSLKSFLN